MNIIYTKESESEESICKKEHYYMTEVFFKKNSTRALVSS